MEGSIKSPGIIFRTIEAILEEPMDDKVVSFSYLVSSSGLCMLTDQEILNDEVYDLLGDRTHASLRPLVLLEKLNA